jgi:hypothetical protein
MDVIRFLYVSLGSSTVQLHDSLGSRRACSCSEVGFSSQNDDRAWMYYRRAALCWAFLWTKGLNARLYVKKCYLFTVGSVCRVKRFTAGKRFTDEEVETDVRKWLRQQSKNFYDSGFDELVKRWQFAKLKKIVWNNWRQKVQANETRFYYLRSSDSRNFRWKSSWQWTINQSVKFSWWVQFVSTWHNLTG